MENRFESTVRITIAVVAHARGRRRASEAKFERSFSCMMTAPTYASDGACSAHVGEKLSNAEAWSESPTFEERRRRSAPRCKSVTRNGEPACDSLEPEIHLFREMKAGSRVARADHDSAAAAQNRSTQGRNSTSVLQAVRGWRSTAM